MEDTPVITCSGCGLPPEQIGEYIGIAAEYDITPTQFVILEEGTYNPVSGHFWCTDCYIEAGVPLGTAP